MPLPYLIMMPPSLPGAAIVGHDVGCGGNGRRHRRLVRALSPGGGMGIDRIADCRFSRQRLQVVARVAWNDIKPWVMGADCLFSWSSWRGFISHASRKKPVAHPFSTELKS